MLTTQSAGFLMFSSIITSPMLSAVMRPDIGFFMLLMCPQMSA